MIDKMRSKAASWVAKILAFFLILSFAVWGIGDVVRGPVTGNVIAEVGNSEITRSEFSNQIRKLMTAVRRQFGNNFDLKQAQQLGLVDQTVNQMINSRLLKLEANKLGLTAGEELIRQNIFEDPRFKQNRQFNRNAFQRFLQQESLTEATYVSLLKNDITKKQIINIIRSSTHSPKVLLNNIYKYQNEKRIAEVVFIPNQKSSSIKKANETDIFNYYKKHSKLFKTPEYRSLSAIFLDPKEIAKELSPPIEKLKKEYEYRKEIRTKPERRLLHQVLFQSKKKAHDFFNKARSKGTLFQNLNKKEGQKFNKLGFLEHKDLTENLANAVFNPKKPGLIPPTQTPLGWHVIQVKKIETAKVPSFSELRTEIKRDLSLEMAVDNIIKLTGKLDDALAGGASIDEADNNIGSRVIRLKNVDIAGNGENGKPALNLPKSSMFLKKLFSTPIGETTNIEETKKGEFFVIKVESKKAPEIRPFSSVRNKVQKMWRKGKIRSKTKMISLKFKEGSKGSLSLAKLAKEKGFSIKTSKPFFRFQSSEKTDIPNTLRAPIFEAKQGEVIINASDKGYYVALIKKIIPADLIDKKEKIGKLKSQIQDIITSDNIDQYVSALKNKFPTKIDQKAIANAISDRL
ncbi:MAG: hypothetical protein CMM83_00095 [Rhodospirillales bacterium]|nr:hypothetical protein [Rhodospirillales bacterium]